MNSMKSYGLFLVALLATAALLGGFGPGAEAGECDEDHCPMIAGEACPCPHCVPVSSLPSARDSSGPALLATLDWPDPAPPAAPAPPEIFRPPIV